MIDLKMVIENYPYCLKSSSNLRALLKDLYPELEYRSRIFIISVILDSNVLRTIKTSVEITETDIYKLAKSLVNEYGFSEDLCIECLELWSTSLGKYKGQTIKVNKIKENISKPTKIIKQLKNNMFTIKDGCLTKYTGGSVRKVTIPEGVASIGAKAFSRAEVQYVYLPSTCMSIEDSAFEYSEVAEIVLPDGLENIGSGAFAYCEKLRKIVLPPKIKSIYRDTFYKCKALSNVELNEGLTSIGEMAFCDCQSLVSVEVPKSVKSISSSAFFQCDCYFTIIGEKGSYAEKYSKNKMFKFEKKNDLTIIEVGDILEGKIVNITKFVAFVELPGLKTGMIHISEIASNYVEDITQYVKIGQLVKVKVMSILDDKISLSMRQAK